MLRKKEVQGRAGRERREEKKTEGGSQLLNTRKRDGGGREGGDMIGSVEETQREHLVQDRNDSLLTRFFLSFLVQTFSDCSLPLFFERPFPAPLCYAFGCRKASFVPPSHWQVGRQAGRGVEALFVTA